MIHSLMHFIFNSIIILLDVIIIICFINIVTYDFSRFEMSYYFFEQNWSNNLIKSLTISQSNIFNISYESLLNISFQGTKIGCSCIKTENNEKILYDEKCEPSSLNGNCKTVNSLKPQYLTKFYINNIGYQISIERNKIINYLELLSKNFSDDFYINNTCNKKNIIDCGIIDSIGNHLCSVIIDNCYKLKINYDQSIKNNSNIFEHFYNIFNNNQNLSYSTEFISIFNYKIPCILQDESYYSPAINYKLLYEETDNSIIIQRTKNNGCSSKLLQNIKTDIRWKKIHTFNISNLINEDFKNNLKLLPDFPFDTYYFSKFNLLSRNYIGFQKNCKNFINIVFEIENFSDHLKINFFVYLFCALIIFPYYLLLIVMITQTESLNFCQNFLLEGTYSLIIYVFLYLILIEYHYVKEKYSLIEIIANKYCSDNLSNNLFFSLLNDLFLIRDYINYGVYWTILMFGMSLLKLILVVTKSFKKRIMIGLLQGNQALIIGNTNFNVIGPVETQLIC